MDFFPFDDDYVRRLREGDPETEAHFKKYFDLLLRMKLSGRLRSRSEIDDAIQDVYLRVFNGLRSEGGGVHDGHKFGAYVLGICNHRLQELARKHHDETDIDDVVILSDEQQFNHLVNDERKKFVQAMLEWLEGENGREARIIRALFIDELDKDQICKEWVITRANLRLIVHRALEKFREKYDDPDRS
jgi:RNA polymerase sigma-70 factor, ECF subfamily